MFIHGFTGHPERTWSHKGGVCNDQHNDRGDDNERPRKSRKYPWSASPSTKRSGPVYWPRDLVPRTVPNARVLTYGYDTRIGHWLGPAVSKNTIYDIARNFLVSLEAERLAEPSRPLLFIAHSLGGIVVKEALRQSHRHQMINGPPHSIYEATCGIIFFGTPHGGADPRGWLQHIAERAIKAAGYKVNEQIFNSLLPSSEWLRMLRDEFGPMVRRKKWIVYSFQEQYGVGLLNDNKVRNPNLGPVENTNLIRSLTIQLLVCLIQKSRSGNTLLMTTRECVGSAGWTMRSIEKFPRLLLES